MRYRAICEHCGELHECDDGPIAWLRCSKCGGEVAGPVAYPVPQTREERCQVLASPLYRGVAARGRGPIRSAW